MSHTILYRLSILFVICTLSPIVISASIPESLVARNDHVHPPVSKRVPGTWYHREDHPAHALFRRAPTTDGVTYPEVGSSAWAAAYPTGKPDDTALPQAWTDALNAAISAGKIPDIPPSTLNNGNPYYPGNLDPSSTEVCSTYVKCRGNDNVIWDAPDGVLGAGFDDGPLPTSDALYTFLQENGVHATHFFIGVNILNNPKEFMMAFDDLEDDIAVHTWTHPYMTTFDNAAVLGELGWTMEIIHNSTGGRLPKYWRPPYGDADNRVIAIAKEVFGLTTIVWNQDTEDWSIGEAGGTTSDAVHASLTKWLTGPKSPGLIILEHELTTSTVQAFIDAFPMIKGNGWDITSVSELYSSPYQNADGDNGAVTPVTEVVAFDGTVSTSSTNSSGSSSSTTTAAGSASTSAGNNGSSNTPGSGGKQANSTNTSSGASPSASGSSGLRQQQNGAVSYFDLAFWDLRGVFAAFGAVFVSAAALV